MRIMGPILSILVVDDDDTILWLIHDTLSPEYRVEMAHSCLEATDLLTARRFSLLIIDLELPILDGASFIRMLRAAPEFDSLPVLITTAYEASANKIPQIPATQILHRPFKLYQLLKLVDEMAHSAPESQA